MTKHVSELEVLRGDIAENFHSIVVSMEEEVFANILTSYGTNLDHIHRTYDEQKLEMFQAYEEIIEHPAKVDRINISIQACINSISSLYDNNSNVNSIRSSLRSSNLDGSPYLQDELKKINELFYSNLSRV